MLSPIFLVIILGYFLLRYSIHAGFQAESFCLSVLIFLQQVTYPFSNHLKKKNIKSQSGMGSSDPNRKKSNNFNQQPQFSPKNV